MDKTVKSRLDGIDILKCICAFAIICIHKAFPGEFGQYVMAIARFGVPIFLMISGFFYTSLIEKESLKKHLKKMLGIFFSSNILYFVFNWIINVLKNNASEYIYKCFSIKSILKFLLFNVSPFGQHLWYLGAIIYVIIITETLRKITTNWKKVLYIVTPFFIIGDLLLGKYSIILWGKELVPYIVVRNFAFVGIPNFTIGLFLSEYKELYSKVYKYKFINLLLIFLFVITTILERFLLIKYEANATRDQYISTTFLAISLFILFTSSFWNGEKLDFLKKIGKNHSLMIYIIHPIMITMLNRIVVKLGLEKQYLCIAPIWVFGTSLLCSLLYRWSKKRLMNMKQKKSESLYSKEN